VAYERDAERDVYPEREPADMAAPDDTQTAAAGGRRFRRGFAGRRRGAARESDRPPGV
jgi:hypothetical protein